MAPQSAPDLPKGVSKVWALNNSIALVEFERYLLTDSSSVILRVTLIYLYQSSYIRIYTILLLTMIGIENDDRNNRIWCPIGLGWSEK